MFLDPFDYWGLLDHVSVRDLFFHYSSTGLHTMSVRTPLYLYSGLVVDLRDSVITGSLN